MSQQANQMVLQGIIAKPIRIFLADYVNLYVTSQGHGHRVRVWSLLNESRMDHSRPGWWGGRWRRRHLQSRNNRDVVPLPRTKKHRGGSMRATICPNTPSS